LSSEGLNSQVVWQGIAESPALLRHDRFHHRHGNQILEMLQFPEDERAMRAHGHASDMYK
jgi:hypothetical protein